MNWRVGTECVYQIARRVKMSPHYYLMKSKKILRHEWDMSFNSLPFSIKERCLHPHENLKMDQEQANWRVVLFRDEIMEMDEYTEWLASPEAMEEESYEFEYDLTAN